MSPDPLDSLLNRWREVPPAPPSTDLNLEVWRRIADAETSFQPNLWGTVEKAFYRPSFACAFVASCMLAGLFLAEIRVSRQQAQRNVQLARAYVHLIDPLLDPSGASHMFASETTQP